ncbi:Asp-tRNA(Asn)/Glu-tRNA(Gln) amidotransferase subunit GatB [Desulfonauticus submarinus]|nr:Asp-tRNA(Asn)/Glu-tRNA(Gln) amidotransferase subunit GatB [Desulfonauticus submarinus]
MREARMEFESVIGLEVHAQLKTKSKIFCSCSTAFGDEPNVNTCPVCTGMPGVLPILNKKVVEFAIKMGLAVNCTINTYSIFARKNYFYPDLPKGYQISQYELPIAEHGYLVIQTNKGDKKIGITRIHMEEDAGKSIHSSSESFIDLNRTGVPLLEIVSEPDLRSPEEAVSYLKALRSILVYLDICDGNMEEGSFRCDANVSIRPKGENTFGIRTEIKNINSFRHVQKALEYEIERQIDLVLDGEEVVQETRLYDPQKNITKPMRSKEEAHDYRYFPDPDLVPLVLDENWINEIKKSLPELPESKFKRFKENYGLGQDEALTLTAEKDLADFFEKTVELGANPKKVSNWILSELLRVLHEHKLGLKESKFTPFQLYNLLELINKGLISGKIGKNIFEHLVLSGDDPEKYVKEKGLIQISDSSELEAIIEKILDNFPKEVERYKNGEKKLQGFFVGQVMKATKGKANPQLVNSILQKKLV